MNVFIFYLKQILYRWNFCGIKISWINYYKFYFCVLFFEKQKPWNLNLTKITSYTV